MQKSKTRVKRAKVASRVSKDYRLGICWVARETSKGWKLGISVSVNGKETGDQYIRGLLVADPNAISKALAKSPYGILFVHMKNSDWSPPKKGERFMVRKLVEVDSHGKIMKARKTTVSMAYMPNARVKRPLVAGAMKARQRKLGTK